jgi:hypothetical protein
MTTDLRIPASAARSKQFGPAIARSISALLQAKICFCQTKPFSPRCAILNSFGLLAPIFTGYLVEATGNFNPAFVLAGALALVGATVTLALARHADRRGAGTHRRATNARRLSPSRSSRGGDSDATRP